MSYVRLDNPGTPVADIKRLLPSVSNPANLPDAMLEAMGVARCVVIRPALEWWQTYGDAVIDAEVRPVTITHPPINLPLEEVKALASARIEAARDERIAAGLPYVFPSGAAGTIQLRQQDVSNLLTIATTALSAISMGMPVAMAFRDAENTQHPMTPEEARVMTLQASSYGAQIYAVSWALKDAVEAASDVAGVVAAAVWPEA